MLEKQINPNQSSRIKRFLALGALAVGFFAFAGHQAVERMEDVYGKAETTQLPLPDTDAAQKGIEDGTLKTIIVEPGDTAQGIAKRFTPDNVIGTGESIQQESTAVNEAHGIHGSAAQYLQPGTELVVPAETGDKQALVSWTLTYPPHVVVDILFGPNCG